MGEGKRDERMGGREGEIEREKEREMWRNTYSGKLVWGAWSYCTLTAG